MDFWILAAFATGAVLGAMFGLCIGALLAASHNAEVRGYEDVDTDTGGLRYPGCPVGGAGRGVDDEGEERTPEYRDS